VGICCPQIIAILPFPVILTGHAQKAYLQAVGMLFVGRHPGRDAQESD